MDTRDAYQPITSYKGFDENLRCTPNGTPMQYEIGRSYEHDGEVATCKSGFHACEYPLDALRYYAPASSRFAVVEQSGKIARHDGDSKVASSRLAVKAEIGIAGIVKAAIEYTMARVTPAKGASNGDGGAASNSGDRGAASNSGYRGAASNSGDRGAASNSGYGGAASNSGYGGAASNSGDGGAASNSGYSGAASNSGDGGAASNSGYRGAASNSGDGGAASNSGYSGAASNSGAHGIAADFSGTGKARSIATGAIFLVRRARDGTITHVFSSKVGENGVEPDVWYELGEDGRLAAVGAATAEVVR